MFEHIWRQTLKKFLDVKMHGVDWLALKSEYARFLPYLGNDRDFAELCSEMQGELNASHTGCRYRPTRTDADNTAALGFFPDPKHTGPGIGILEVIDGGPLQKAGTKIKAGTSDLGDRRHDDRGGQQLVPAVESQGRHSRPAVAARSAHEPALGRVGEADLVDGPVAAPVPALEARQSRRGREALGRPARLLTHPRHERRALSRDLPGDLRPRHGEGGHRPRHAVQRRRQSRRGAHRLSERSCLHAQRAARTVPGRRAIHALEPAVHRGDERRQLTPTPTASRWPTPSSASARRSGCPCPAPAARCGGSGSRTAIWCSASPRWRSSTSRATSWRTSKLEPNYLVVPDPALEAAGRDQQLEKAVEVLLSKLPKKSAASTGQ